MLHRLWRSDGSGETLDKVVYIWREYAVRETALKKLLCIFILLQKKKKKKVRKVPAEVTRERCPATAPPPGMASPVCTYEDTHEHTMFSNLNLKAVKVPLLCIKCLLCFPFKWPPLWNLGGVNLVVLWCVHTQKWKSDSRSCDVSKQGWHETKPWPNKDASVDLTAEGSFSPFS